MQYDADVSDNDSKERRKLSEVGVYTVKDGKIIREEFYLASIETHVLRTP